MSVSAADGAHEFVAAPELAEVAERLGVPLHAGDRARFEVIDREREAAPHRRRLGWLGSVSTGEHTSSERAKDVQLSTSGRFKVSSDWQLGVSST